ncbi:MAG: molecular chaperone HtpG [bacterium]
MSSTKNITEKHEFKAEVNQLLNILVHSLYTHKEIFLRELVSNASDALDKIRFESISGNEITDKDLPLEIKISCNSKKNILTVSDTGIGMTKDEIIANVGTIAKSGTAEFLKKLGETKEDTSSLIGKFGVGFYSVFMVAKEVIIKTKSAQLNEPAIKWTSDGLGSYTIEELDEKLSRGTTIEVHLKEEEKEFAENYRIESTIKKHSNFISFPIKVDDKQVNTISAIWREPKTSVTREQYNEFYKFLSYDADEPFDIIHTSVDAPIQFNCLLFIPKKSNDMFGMYRDEHGLDLYVRRVLIQHKNKDLLPEYLGFVKGVVDSEDLPLNISRETLQEDIVFHKISSSVTNNVLNHLAKLATENVEKYNEFWKEHAKLFKVGYSDYANREKFSKLLRFNSSVSKDENELISLEEYSSRIKDKQKEIYYLTGSSREAVAQDPHLEIFKSKGIEVLYLYDPIDEFVLSSLMKFNDLEFKSADQADLSKLEKLESVTEDKEKAEELGKEDKLHFSSLCSRMKEILSDRVEDVKESKRLKDSPAVLVGKEDGLSSTMQKILKVTSKDTSLPKKVLEVNQEHKLMRNLLSIYKNNPKDEFITDVTEQLFESAMLLDGYLTDPHKLVQRINAMMTQSSELYPGKNK